MLTDQGVLIKNNVADLQADWGRLEIGGTAAAPLFDGRVDVQPGGIITAFGQALRIDEASFEWSGRTRHRTSHGVRDDQFRGRPERS